MSLAIASPSGLSRRVVVPMLTPRGRAVGVLDHEVRLGERVGGEDVIVLAGVGIWSPTVSPTDEVVLMGYCGNSSEEPEPSESGLGISGCCMVLIPCDGPREHVRVSD
mgnify:CR=1 FL=1